MANEFSIKLDERAVRAAAERTGRTLTQMVQKIAERTFENIVRRTPVDTGWARANWIPTLNAPDSSRPGSAPKGERGIPNDPLLITAAISQGKAGDIFFLTNAVPYIIALEYGHSQQAPSGMVRLSIEETRVFFQNYANEGKA